MNVLVLKGGDSPEREVSLRSAAAMVAALQQTEHAVQEYDPKAGLAGILDIPVDVVLPILHGIGGEDGSVQEFLEHHHIAFMGSDSRVSRLCFDKLAFKKKIIEAGVTTPKYEIVDADSFPRAEIAAKPFVLKPIDGGSSIDTHIVRNGIDTYEMPPHLFASHSRMLLEELVVGTEITIGILGDEALPVIEIIPPNNEEFDYLNKYNGKTQELCPPIHIDEAIQRTAQELALEVHRLVGARHLSRVDMIINPDGSLYVLELNTIPGLTDQSLLPLAARTAGIEMPELAGRLVRMSAR